ncbi:MAG TPA: ribonuclease H-like domain-containing protein [bacterium]|nr:ribonuclease H-like domain-containing protein [bacterium]
MSGDLRAGIARLLRGDTVPTGAGPRRPPPSEPEPVTGARLETIGGHRVCVIRRPVRELLPDQDLAGDLRRAFASFAARDPDTVYAGLRPARECRPEDVAVVDLETTGFWGCPVFLVGMVLWDGDELVSIQVLARDYPEERAMLAASGVLLASRSLLVTFNGKSYDVPCFRERCAYHGIRTTVPRLAHVDVLHASRRRWKRELPDCRLQTLEWEVVGLRRAGDVPSAEIPGVYHDFVATGDARALDPVLHHGRVDTVTTASLFARLLEDPPAPPAPRRAPRASRKRKPGLAA